MRYFYNDKLNEKISFNDLTTNQKLMSFSFLYLSIRKAYLFLKRNFKMKILYITKFFPPEYGGIENLI